MTVYYKIRNKDGKFSSGGHPPKFLKGGKVWPLPQLKSHLRLVQSYGKNFDVYKDCELIAYVESPDPAGIDLAKLIEPLEQELVVKKLKGTS